MNEESLFEADSGELTIPLTATFSPSSARSWLVGRLKGLNL